MAEESLSLTYRELAERLEISTDAARMKARRAVKAGRWRIIPGNHPNDPVRIELPASEVGNPNATGGERAARSTGERRGRTSTRTPEPDAATQLVEALQAAHNRIEALTDQLTHEKDQHTQTAIELAQAETREMGLSEEIHRLEGTIRHLEAELHMSRRSWWKRIRGK